MSTRTPITHHRPFKEWIEWQNHGRLAYNPRLVADADTFTAHFSSLFLKLCQNIVDTTKFVHVMGSFSPFLSNTKHREWAEHWRGIMWMEMPFFIRLLLVMRPGCPISQQSERNNHSIGIFPHNSKNLKKSNKLG